MGIGYFVDKTKPPTEEDLQTAMGEAYPLWAGLTAWLAETFLIEGQLTYGGKNYGWNRWYKRSGRAVTTLYPQVDGFTAQVVLGKVEVEQALTLPLGERVAALVRETPQFHDGRWLFIRVESEQDLADVRRLLELKPRPRKKVI